MNRRELLIAGLGAASTVLLLQSAGAQTWPSRPITWVYAYPAGGGADPLARRLAEALKDRLGQPIVVENRAGAAGTIGAASVARATDGHTFLFNVSQELAAAPALYRSLPYNPELDFVPVCRVATLPLILVANPGAGVRSIAELAAAARQAPGTISIASAGNGSLQHLAAELMQRQLGVTLNHIPYKGVAEVTRDLIGGQVALGFVGASTVLPHIRESRLVALGLSTAQRLDGEPGIAPLAEYVAMRGFDLPQWFGMVAPANVPAAVVQRLAEEIRLALGSDGVKAILAAGGMTPAYQGPAEYGAFIALQRDVLGRVIREAGIKL